MFLSFEVFNAMVWEAITNQINSLEKLPPIPQHKSQGERIWNSGDGMGYKIGKQRNNVECKITPPRTSLLVIPSRHILPYVQLTPCLKKLNGSLKEERDETSIATAV